MFFVSIWKVNIYIFNKDLILLLTLKYSNNRCLKTTVKCKSHLLNNNTWTMDLKDMSYK